MTEDKTEPIEKVKEKEEKRKIRVVEQIDNRLAIQGQAYIKGQLKDALSIAYEIIDLAKPEKLNSFVKDQEDLIAQIKKLLKQKEERELEKLRAEQERKKLEKIKEIKNDLKNLEYIYKAGFDAEDFSKTKESIVKAKTLLSQLDKDKELKKKWQDFERQYLAAKLKKDLIEKAQTIIEESIILKEKFQFEPLKPKLADIIKEFKENNIKEHLNELEFIQKDIINAEKAYLNVLENIEKLTKEIKILQDNRDFNKAIQQCKNLLKLCESIEKTELSEEYSKILTNLQKELEFEELKESVNKLNDEGLNLLKTGDISSSLKKFEMIKGAINFYLEQK
ncbi:MAG: hypothetical protein ACFE9S_13220 [Candidatus Hermodarchaeota archaeon]